MNPLLSQLIHERGHSITKYVDRMRGWEIMKMSEEGHVSKGRCPFLFTRGEWGGKNWVKFGPRRK